MIQIMGACGVYWLVVGSVFVCSGRFCSFSSLFLWLLMSRFTSCPFSSQSGEFSPFFVSGNGLGASTLSLEYLSTEPDHWYEPDVD